MEKPFDIKTHNGCITITSHKTGAHRTVKIQTHKQGKYEGKRLVLMLVGTDNEKSYKRFGFVNPDGRIWVWRQCQTEFFIKLARILEHPENYLDQATYQFEGRCRICNKKLTNPKSLTTGLGPECAKRNF